MKAIGARLRSRVVRLWDRPATRAAAIAIVLCAVVAGFLAAFLVSRPHPEPALLDPPITIKQALSTSATLFGDSIEAEVDVYTDDGTIDPRSVRVSTDFTPYRAVATRVDRARLGHVSLLRSRIVLACLTKACVPPRAASGLLNFRPLRVTYRTGTGDASIDVPWTQIQLSSRLPRDPAALLGTIDTPPPLDPGFAVSPALLRTVLLLGAALLALVGAALVVTGVWPPSFYALHRWHRLSPLERSLLQVEAAAHSGDETVRRHVLDELANRLAEVPSPSLEARTRSLAWGASTPEPEALSLVAKQVRTSLNGGSRR